MRFEKLLSSIRDMGRHMRGEADYTVIARLNAPDIETVHLLKSPATAVHLARSIEQYRQGQVTHQALVDVD